MSTSLPWKLIGLVGIGLAAPSACSSSECDGPSGLCIEVPKGAANAGGRGGMNGAAGERDAGMAGEIVVPTRAGSSGKGGTKGKGGSTGRGGASGKPSSGGMATGGTGAADPGGMGGDETGGAPQAGESGSGGSISNGGLGGTSGIGGRGGRGGRGGSAGSGAGPSSGAGPNFGGSGGRGGAGGSPACNLGEIPETCGASSGGAAGEVGVGGEGGANGQGWCEVEETGGAGGHDSTGTGGTVGSGSGGMGGKAGSGGRSSAGAGGRASVGAGGTATGGAAFGGGPTKPKLMAGSLRQFFPIDDLEDENPWVGPVLGARGAWYVAADGNGATFPSSGCPPVTSPATEFVDHASNAAMHFYGSGTFGYAQVGISVRSGAPACDQPLDAAGMTGIRFWAKGTTALQNIHFMLGNPDNLPPELGGTCQGVCFVYPGTFVLLNDEWREYDVSFADMGVSTPMILNLIWQAEVPGPTPQSGCFDFWVDDVAFYKDE